MAAECKATPAQVALAWQIARPDITALNVAREVGAWPFSDQSIRAREMSRCGVIGTAPLEPWPNWLTPVPPLLWPMPGTMYRRENTSALVVAARMRSKYKEVPCGMIRLSGSAQFVRLLKGTNGLTPHAHVSRLRLARAHELVLLSRLPLAAIAAETGLSSQSHMTTQFVRRWGTPPGALRRSGHAGKATHAADIRERG